MASIFVEIVPLSNRQRNCIPLAAIRWHDIADLLRLEGHLTRFSGTRTHLSCRLYLAVDFLGVRRRASSSQCTDLPQDFPKQVPGHGDFGQLERDVPTMADHFGPDLDQLLVGRSATSVPLLSPK
jgi:hypothetical protein